MLFRSNIGIPGAVKAKPPDKPAPQLASVTDAPPEGGDWLTEIKFDGYRILAAVDHGKVRLLTRNGNDWTDRLSAVAKAVSQLDVGSARLARRLLGEGGADGVERGPQSNADIDSGEEELVRLSISARLKRTGKEMKLIVDGPADAAPADTSLIRLLVRAQKVGARLFETGSPTLKDLAREENITASYASRIVRLTFLAPDIVAAILAGKQPPELTANKLMADTRLPLDWPGQRTALGFA